MSTNESETTSLTYPKGPVGDYKLMSTDILKCLLKFGNTIMSKKTVKNAMDMIYMKKHGRHLPKNFQNDPVYKKQFNYCKKRIESMISKTAKFPVTIREAGPWRTSFNAPSLEYIPTSPTSIMLDNAIIASCWIVEKQGLVVHN